MDRAARLGDGFIFTGGTIERAVDAFTRLGRRVSGLSRSPAEFGGEFVAPAAGDTGWLHREIEAWRAAGGTHVSLVTMGLGLDSVDAHIERLATLAGELGLS